MWKHKPLRDFLTSQTLSAEPCQLCTNLINHIIPTLQPELRLFNSPLMKNEDKIARRLKIADGKTEQRQKFKHFESAVLPQEFEAHP